MPTVHLIHGFNVRDGGRRTIAKIAPYAEKWGQPRLFSYGWLGLMGVWFLNPRIVKQLVDRVMPGDIGIAHSNGCVLLQVASIYGAPFRFLVYLAPALSSNVQPAGDHVEKIFVFHSDSDHVVKLAAWLRALVPWAPLGCPLWGDMGSRGYQPRSYAEANYKPTGSISRVIHAVNMACISVPLLLQILRVFLGIPVGLAYWLIAGPVEVGLTYLFNNIVGNEPEMALTVRRAEDRNFILYALALPLLFWAVVAITLLW